MKTRHDPTLPYAHRTSDGTYYQTEEEYGKTLSQIYEDKQERKLKHRAQVEILQRSAQRLTQKIREAILKFRHGGLDPVSVVIAGEEATEKYKEDCAMSDCVSAFEKKDIWNAALKQNTGDVWTKEVL